MFKIYIKTAAWQVDALYYFVCSLSSLLIRQTAFYLSVGTVHKVSSYPGFAELLWLFVILISIINVCTWLLFRKVERSFKSIKNKCKMLCLKEREICQNLLLKS